MYDNKNKTFLVARFIFTIVTGVCAGIGCSHQKMVDVVVVGGGLAGLAATYEIQAPGVKVLLLEKEKRLGGRIQTRNHNGEPYEKGALFAYSSIMVPPECGKPSPRIFNRKPVGFSLNGTVYLGRSVRLAMEKYNWSPREREILEHVFKSHEVGTAFAFPHLIQVFAAFFNAIHPGELKKYLKVRWQDSLIRWPVSERKNGNSELVEFYTKCIQAGVLLNAKVLRVEETGGHRVKVTYTYKGKRRQVVSRYVVVAVPAPIANEIVMNKKPVVAEFLQSVRYVPGFVVVLFVPPGKVIDFSYVVFADGEASSVFAMPCVRKNCTKLYVYYARDRAVKMSTLPVKKAVSRTVRELKRAGVGSLSIGDVLFADTGFWQYLAPVIDAAFERIDARGYIFASEHVILAGEYAWGQPVTASAGIMPYGMYAAYRSGVAAGETVATLLGEKR